MLCVCVHMCVCCVYVCVHVCVCLQECSEGLNWLDAKSRLQYALVHTCRVQRRPVEMPQYRLAHLDVVLIACSLTA